MPNVSSTSMKRDAKTSKPLSEEESYGGHVPTRSSNGKGGPGSQQQRGDAVCGHSRGAVPGARRRSKARLVSSQGDAFLSFLCRR